MNEQLWAVVRRDGTLAWQGFRDGDDEIDVEPGAVLIAIDRIVESWERIDPVTGQVSTDRDARIAAIDAAHVADNGPDAIARGRTLKLLEALVIEATGRPVDGVLSVEAALRGIDVADMARVVIDAAEQHRSIEIARMRAKAAARAGDA